jgi:hypothetical protein
MKTRNLAVAVVFSIFFCLCLASGVFAGTVTYSYDAAGRLIKADYGTQSIAYTYDSAGNILQREVSAASAPTPGPSSSAHVSSGGTGGSNVTPAGPDHNLVAAPDPGWINSTTGSDSGNR